MLKKTALFVWIFHQKLLVSLIISLAVVLLVLRAFAFYLEETPHLIEELIEAHLQTQVKFDEIKVGVHPLFPSVSMRNFTIRTKSDEEKLLEFTSASVRLDIPRSILRGQIIIDTLTLKGLSAIIRRNSKSEISIAELQLTNAQPGKPDSGQSLQAFLALLNQTNFMISESEIYFIDEMQKIPTVFVSDINIKMKNNKQRHQISLRAKLNDSDTLLDFRLDFNGRIDDISNWNGQVYAAVDNLNQQTLLHFLQKEVLQVEEFQLNDIEANSRIWSTINKGNLQSIQGEVVIENANLKRVDNNHSIHFDRLSSNFKLQRHHTNIQNSDTSIADAITKETNWMFDLYDLNLSVNSKMISEKYISLKFHKAENELLSQLQVFFNKLDFNEFSHVISFFAPKEFNEKVYSYLKPRGSLENIMTTFQFDASEMPIDIQHYQVQTDINDFGMNSILSLPKVRHFSAQLVFNETTGRAIIDSADMKLHLKSLFRDSWPISQLTGELFWQKEGKQWLLGAENLVIKGPHFAAANADLKLWIAETGQVFMDLTGFYENVNVDAISNYVPAKVMSQGLVKWLDNALISGLVPDGGIAFRGNLSEFPYKDHSGNMDIVFNTQDVLLEYLDDWPKLSNINAQVQFTQKGMKIEGRHSKIFSAQSQNVQVDLDDYLERILLIKGDINSSLDDGIKFLQQSKLVSDDVLGMIDAKDEIDINLDLKIPLEKGIADNKIGIRLNNADYYPPGFERKKGLVSHLKGDIMIHNKSINARKLSAQLMGLPAQISIKTDKKLSKSTADPDISVNIDSKFSVKQLKKYNFIPESFIPLSDQLSGIGNIKLTIDLPNKQRALAFNIYSSLKNISSQLPAPFNKQAKQSTPLIMSYAEIKPSGRNKKTPTALVKMKYSKELSLVVLIDSASKTEGFKLLKGNLAFAGDTAKLPGNNLLRITGALRDVPLEQWQSVFDSSAKNKKNIQPGKKSERPAKTLSIPVELAMTELVLPELQFGANDPDKPKNSSGTKNKSLTGSRFDVESFPLVNGHIDSLKLGKLDLGRFSMQSSRVDKGIVFDVIALEGALLTFNGKGKWHHRNTQPEVDLEGIAEIPSLEKLAVAFGNDRLVRQSKAKISAYVSWPGGLNDFSKETVEARLNFNVEKGAWIEGEPGAAGRLLGLLNMNALVRRLSLDFSDVSAEGFKFDRIEGDFRIKDAMAYTDNFRIFSPSAKILVTGHTGLVTEEIDQRVTVIPEVSATLPIAGAVVAGPAGAAVVWIGQKILGDQLNKVTAFDYTIKGNWDQPVIKKEKTSTNTLNNIKKLFRLKKNESAVPDTNPIFDSNTSELP